MHTDSNTHTNTNSNTIKLVVKTDAPSDGEDAAAGHDPKLYTWETIPCYIHAAYQAIA